MVIICLKVLFTICITGIASSFETWRIPRGKFYAEASLPLSLSCLQLLDEDLYFPGSKSEGGDNTTATSTPAPSVHQYSGDSKQLSDYPPSSSFNSESSDFTPESLVPSTDDDQEKRARKGTTPIPNLRTVEKTSFSPSRTTPVIMKPLCATRS